MLNIAKFQKNSDGNVAVMVAGLTALLLGAVGFAIDTSKLRSHEANMQAAADAAALAGASIAVVNPGGKRGEIADQAFFENIDEETLGVVEGEPVIRFDDGEAAVTVTVRARPRLFLMGMFTGSKTGKISVKSVAGYQTVDKRPIAVALVLDVSGSMGWNTSDGRVKIEVLKEAANGLLDSVDVAASKNGARIVDVYTAVSTYNSALVEAPQLRGGFTQARTIISGLTAGGGTSSTDALDNSLNALLAHPRRAIDNHREYLVFMTDGDNNNAQDDVFSEEFCVRARENGVTVYSVAFAAPDKGKQLLLKCASSDADPARKAKTKGVFPFGATARPCQVALNSPVIFERCRATKEGYYFDAETAVEFQEVFENIGASIGNEAVRLKG